jgi:xanthine dehydrogenase iron-sulfur cluster and FAD-binding subunit A
MSSEQQADSRTVVPGGIADPVEAARAELKAALAAIEQRANIPRRVEQATTRGAAQLREVYEKQPALTIAAVVAGAATVGGLIWVVARWLSR